MIALLLALGLAHADWLDDPAPDDKPPAAQTARPWPAQVQVDPDSRSVWLRWGEVQPDERVVMEDVARWERARPFEGHQDELFLVTKGGRKVLVSRGAQVDAQALLLPAMTGLVVADLPPGVGHTLVPDDAPPPPELNIGPGEASLGAIQGTPATPLPVSEVPLPPPPDLTGEGGGTLTREQISRVLLPAAPRFQSCHTRALGRNADVHGAMTLELLVATDGAIEHAWVSADETGDPALVTCIIDEIQHLRFDAPRGGSARVSYPLQF